MPYHLNSWDVPQILLVPQDIYPMIIGQVKSSPIRNSRIRSLQVFGGNLDKVRAPVNNISGGWPLSIDMNTADDKKYIYFL